MKCTFCHRAAVGICCSAHDKDLCHRCYRETHFVQRCVKGCTACAAEGLPVVLRPLELCLSDTYSDTGKVLYPDHSDTRCHLPKGHAGPLHDALIDGVAGIVTWSISPEDPRMSKPQPTLHPLCETLRDARLETGRSQTEVAAATGVWQSSISDYENGNSVPSVVSLDAWAAALGYVIVLVPMEDR